MRNRYEFVKKLYKDYIIFIVKKDKYYTLDNDNLICKNYNININNINKYNLNYLILDNLDIVKIKEYDNNLYYEYLIKSIFIDLIKKIKE